MRFERILEKHLKEVMGGPVVFWRNPEIGGRYPDLIGISPDSCFIIEVKRTYTERAWEQLEMYLSLLKGILPKKPISLIQACKFLIPGIQFKITTSIEEAIEQKRSVYFFPSYLY